jgi:hypothetical protein
MPAPLPHWHDEPDAYDVVFLGGEQLPGIAHWKPIKRDLKSDTKSPKGTHKGPTTHQGYKPAEIEFTLEVLERDEWDELLAWVDRLEPPPGKEKDVPVAWDIASWPTHARNIEAIGNIRLDGPELRNGIMVLTIKATEFDRPKPVDKGLTGGGILGGKGKPTGLSIGAFADQSGTVLGVSRVATSTGPAKDAAGQPITFDGQPVLAWNLLAVFDDNPANPDGFTRMGGTFNGIFRTADPILADAWAKATGQKPTDDATTTPDQSKAASGPNLVELLPDPSTTETAP